MHEILWLELEEKKPKDISQSLGKAERKTFNK